MSINCNKGYEQSRKDDLESLGYMLVFLAKQYLPWSDIENNNKESRIVQSRKICEKKIKITPEELCSGLPPEFSEYIKYCRKLEFEEEPNYNYIKNLFIAILKRNEQLIDERFIGFIQFSWLKKKKTQKGSNNKQKSTSYSKYSDSKKRKESIHKRLYKQIKDSIDRARSQELPKLRNSNMFKFNVNNISIILNNINTKDKKKTETNNTNNYGIIKTKNEINENNNNKFNKININKRNEKKASFNKLKKINNNTYVKKMNIYNKKFTNNLPVNNQDKNAFNMNLELKKRFHHIINPKNIINLNKSEDFSVDSYSKDQQSFRYYKTLKERNEIKEYRKKNYISIFNNSILSFNLRSQEKKIFPFNKNDFQQVNENNKYLNIFISDIIPLRHQNEIFSYNLNHNM